MSTVTIPKKITKGTELVVIPRKDYEKLLSQKTIPEFKPTETDKKALARARENRAAGKFLTIDELKQKLGFTS